MSDAEKPDLTTLTVQLLSAYVGNNSVAVEALPDLIAATRLALSGETAPVVPPAAEYVPAVSVRKSLASPDHIISMIDGKPYKTLKRHIGLHGMTPAEYRSRYGLPKAYPLVAPTYSEQRRATAARIGLGRKGRGGVASKEIAQVEDIVVDTAASSPEDQALPASVVEVAAETASPPAAKGSRGKLSIAVPKAPTKAVSVKKPRSAKPPKAGGKSKPGSDVPQPVVVPKSVDEVPASSTAGLPSASSAKRPRAKTATAGKPGTAQALPVSDEPIPKKAGRPRKSKVAGPAIGG